MTPSKRKKVIAALYVTLALELCALAYVLTWTDEILLPIFLPPGVPEEVPSEQHIHLRKDWVHGDWSLNPQKGPIILPSPVGIPKAGDMAAPDVRIQSALVVPIKPTIQMPMLASVQEPLLGFHPAITMKGHANWVTGVAFVVGSRVVTSSWDHSVRLWSSQSGQQLAVIGTRPSGIQAMALSHDEKLVAVEDGANRVAVIGEDGRVYRELASTASTASMNGAWVYGIAFSPSDHLLAYGASDSIVRVWNIVTDKLYRDYVGKRRAVIYAAFSADGTVLVTGDDSRTIALWDLVSNEMTPLAGHTKDVLARDRKSVV